MVRRVERVKPPRDGQGAGMDRRDPGGRPSVGPGRGGWGGVLRRVSPSPARRGHRPVESVSTSINLSHAAPRGARRFGLLRLSLLCTLICTPAVVAGETVAAEDPYAAILPISAESVSLLDRAERAVLRGDWKVAVDAMDRLLVLSGGHLVDGDRGLYASPRSRVHGMVSRLPPEGRSAYRLLHGGQAAALLRGAEERHDADAVRRVLDRYPCTRAGERACLILAEWLMDAGRFTEAAAVLRSHRVMHSDPHVPPWIIAGRLSVCLMATGRPEHARITWRRATAAVPRGRDDTDGTTSRRSLIARHLDAPPPALSVRRHGGWPLAGGLPSRAGSHGVMGSSLPASRPWSLTLPVEVAGSPGHGHGVVGRPSADGHGRVGVTSAVTSRGSSSVTSVAGAVLPVRRAVTDGGMLFVKGDRVLMSVDAHGFTPLWTSGIGVPVTVIRSVPSMGRQVMGVGGIMGVGVEGVEGGGSLSWGAWGEEEVSRHMLHDGIGSGIAIVGDKVLSIQWMDAPPPLATRRAASPRRQIVRPGRPGSDHHPNRVVAYSVGSGAVRWESDTTSPAGSLTDPARDGGISTGTSRVLPGAGEALGEVEFLAVPVMVDGVLVSPARMNEDLYAVLLDPATGRMVGHLHLCGTGSGPFDSLTALDPAVEGGRVFIPTGRGLVMALEAWDWHIRWASRYVPGSGGPSAARGVVSAEEDVAEVSGWAGLPLRAVADVVLSSPPDADVLYCLDQDTGRVLWEVERGTMRYVVAATHRHVWVAGEYVARLSVESGEEQWRTRVGEPSGEGVLAGDRLYLPTHEGLVILDADDGSVVDSISDWGGPDGKVELGNLLVWDHSIYSVDFHSVRRFVDIDHAHQQAVARHAENPTAIGPALGLAWMELMRHEPARALAALEGFEVPPMAEPERRVGHSAFELRAAKDEEWDEDRYRQVVHVRVRAMIELAASGTLDGAEALAMLEEARRIALSAEDAIRSAMALGEHYEREGRDLDACRAYADLALSDEGDLMMPDDRGFEHRVRLLVNQRIADLRRGVSGDELAPLARDLRDRLAGARSGDDRIWVQRLAQVTALGTVADEAGLRLASWDVDDLQFERAESRLRRLMRRAASEAATAEAIVRLVMIYLEPAELHLPVTAARLLDRLETEFTSVSLAGEIVGAGGTGVDGGARGSLPVAEIAAILRERMDAEILARHEAARWPVALDGRAREEPAGAGDRGVRRFELEPEEVSTLGAARPLIVRGERREPLIDKDLALVENRKVEVRRVAHAGGVAGDGGARRGQGRGAGREPPLWTAELRLLGEPAVERDTGIVTGQFRDGGLGGLTVNPARAVMDGQTLVINSEHGIHAVGMLTGRRLWSRPFEPPVGERGEGSGSDIWLWAHRGYVVSVDARHRLEVATVENGDRVQWRCAMPERRWRAVRARGAYLVAVDAGLEHVDVFSLEEGRYLGECPFRQEASEWEWINITVYDDVICGPASEREIIALELSAPGVERWRVRMPDRVSQIFKPGGALAADPGEELLVIADRSGRVRVVDAATGATQLEATVPSARGGVVDGALIDGVLYLAGIQNRAARPEAFDQQKWVMAAVDMDTGRVIWEYKDIDSLPHLNGDVFRMAADHIPLAVFRAATRGGHDGPGGRIELVLVDKATGEVVGGPVEASLQRDSNARMISSVDVWPGSIVVTAGTGRLTFPVIPAAKQEARGEGAGFDQDVSAVEAMEQRRQKRFQAILADRERTKRADSSAAELVEELQRRIDDSIRLDALDAFRRRHLEHGAMLIDGLVRRGYFDADWGREAALELLDLVTKLEEKFQVEPRARVQVEEVWHAPQAHRSEQQVLDLHRVGVLP